MEFSFVYVSGDICLSYHVVLCHTATLSKHYSAPTASTTHISCRKLPCGDVSHSYLERADFNALSWDTLMLMGGGLSLGTAVESSGLLLTVGNAMAAFTSTASVFVVLLCFTSLVAAVATVISSTVAAALLLPIVATVGMGIGHAKMLVILCAMMTSGAMGLPVSSFPNANAKAQGTPAGVSLLKGVDFLKTGVPMTVVVLAVILSLGFGLCHVYGD
eukprot:m.68100 g.68100  ORF g.68100 m.68100 type:complete len:217 (-) comp15979_c0_seq4:134-784(-)